MALPKILRQSAIFLLPILALFGAGMVFLPAVIDSWVRAEKPFLKQRLARALDQEVDWATLSSHWQGIDLVLGVSGLALTEKNGATPLVIDEVDVELDVIGSLRKLAPDVIRVHLKELAFKLQVTEDGSFIFGNEHNTATSQSRPTEMLERLARLSELKISNSRLTVEHQTESLLTLESFQLAIKKAKERWDILATFQVTGKHEGSVTIAGSLLGPSLTSHKGVLTISAEKVPLLPKRLWPVARIIDDLAGSVAWTYQSGLKKLRVNIPKLVTADFVGKAKMEMFWASDKQLPKIDLQAEVIGGVVKNLMSYFPGAVLPDEVMTWLSASLQGGVLRKGVVKMQGPLADFPYSGRTKDSGTFSVDLALEKGILKFQPDWPALENLDAEVHIASDSLVATVERGETLGASLKKGNVAIPSFSRDPKLSINAEIAATAEAARSYIEQSPLKAGLGKILDKVTAPKPQSLTLDLLVPLAQGSASKLSVSGIVALTDVSLQIGETAHRVESVRGDLKFTRSKVSAKALSGSLLGSPIKTDLLLTGLDRRSSQMTVNVTGEFLPEPFWQRLDLRGAQLVSGATKIKADASVAFREGRDWQARVRFASELVGLSIDLPEVIKKKTKQSVPLRGEVTINGQDVITVNMRAGEQASAYMKLEPDPQGVMTPSGSIALKGGKLKPMPSPGKIWIDGSNARGQIKMTSYKNEPKWEFALDYLHIMEGFPERQTQGGLVTKKVAPSGVDPRSWPNIVFTCPSFSYRSLYLDDLNLSLYKVRDGLEIRNLSVKSPYFHLYNTQGSWLNPAGRSLPETKLNGIVIIHDLGNILEELEHPDQVAGMRGRAYFDLAWPGAPYDFAFTESTGTANVKLADGELYSVERTLGNLLNLLTLNLLDIAKEQIKILSFRAPLSFKKGVIYSSKTEIALAPVRMKVRGSMNVKEETLDTNVSLTANLGKLLSSVAIGAINPLLGLAYWSQLANSDPSFFDGLTKQRYQIQGKWSDPKIKVQEVAHIPVPNLRR